jgi:deazaflavin-dependent oxidoreductase (nitroreductase family)
VKSRTAHIVGRVLRAPGAFDRRGLRWLLRLVSPAPVVVLTHRGRRSGKVYKTPVEAISADRELGEVIVSPMWGERSDWYRNVLAGGLVEATLRGEALPVQVRQLTEDERREALSAYRRDHPIYSRGIVRMLAGLHDLQGDRFEAVAREIPMLILHRPAAERAPAGND